MTGPAFGTFDILREESTARVRDLIEEAAAGHDGALGHPERQVGDLYASFIDTDRIEELGLAPLQARAVGGRRAVDRRRGARRGPRPARARRRARRAAAALRLARRALARGLRRLPRAARARPARRVVLPRGEARRHPHGLRRPHRSAARASAASPTRGARPTRIMALETPLAAPHWDNVTNRDAIKTYNAERRTRSRRWRPSSLGTPGSRAAGARRRVRRGRRAASRASSRALGAALESVDIADWRAWLTWRCARGAAPVAAGGVRRRELRLLRSHALRRSPTTASGGSAVSASSRPASGRRSASSTRSGGSRRPPKERDERARRQPRRGLPPVLSPLEWMSPETRAEAIAKLDAFTPKIGYPDVWRDYSSLEIVADDLVGNVDARARLRARPQPRQDRPADRPHRVVHAAADGQRLLHAVDERDRLPRGDPAAAVLRPRRRRRRQLRRHRRGHRSRAGTASNLSPRDYAWQWPASFIEINLARLLELGSGFRFRLGGGGPPRISGGSGSALDDALEYTDVSRNHRAARVSKG